MILLILIVVGYIAGGLALGRFYYLSEMKKWHLKNKNVYKTASEIEKENRLEELEAAQALAEAKAKREKEIDELHKNIAEANNQLNRLREIATGKDTAEIVQRENRIESKKNLIRYREQQLANYLDREQQERNHRMRYHHYDIELGFPGTQTTYESARKNFETKTAHVAKSVIVLWPIALAIFIVRFSILCGNLIVKTSIGDSKQEKYVSNNEYVLEAKINALTETDPDLAKMYGDLAKQLES